jgi:hypothetical protein
VDQRLLPLIEVTIAANYPGTRLGIAEYGRRSMPSAIKKAAPGGAA